MLLNNKLVKRYSGAELKIGDYQEFKFNYDDYHYETNRKEILNFIDLISKQKGDTEHFGLILGLEENPFIQFVSICDCGHVHKFSFNLNCYEYRRSSYEFMKRIKKDIAICPNCKKPFTEDLSGYELPLNEDITMNAFLFAGLDEETKTLHIDICEYSFNIKSDRFSIRVYNEENYKLEANKYKSNYEPFEKYATTFDEWFEYGDEVTNLGGFYKDLYETVFDFNPEFKQFLIINESIDNYHSESFINSNTVIKNAIHLFFEYYYIFCNFYGYYSKYEKNIQKCITAILLNQSEYSQYEIKEEGFILKTIETLEPLKGNEYILNNFFEKISSISTDEFTSMTDIISCISFIKEIIESNLNEYITRYIEENVCSLKDLLSLNSLKRQFEEVDIETFIKYIIRGSVNEGEKTSKIISNLFEMKKEEYNIEIKGAYKEKVYKKFKFLKNLNEKDRELFISLENKNNFDGIYKELINY